VQATVGYQFSEAVSTEIGYRYMDTDYTDGAFVYDMASHGLYLGLNFRF
jgi:opacity protein-like surface antigen